MVENVIDSLSDTLIARFVVLSHLESAHAFLVSTTPI